MNNKDKYILAINELKFDENLKESIINNVNKRINKNNFGIMKKMALSFALTQFIFCFFSATSSCYFIY